MPWSSFQSDWNPVKAQHELSSQNMHPARSRSKSLSALDQLKRKTHHDDRAQERLLHSNEDKCICGRPLLQKVSNDHNHTTHPHEDNGSESTEIPWSPLGFPTYSEWFPSQPSSPIYSEQSSSHVFSSTSSKHTASPSNSAAQERLPDPQEETPENSASHTHKAPPQDRITQPNNSWSNLDANFHISTPYTPFNYQLALRNLISVHCFDPGCVFDLSTRTPIFLHDTLQIPATLSRLLDNKHIPALVAAMTPATLGGYTTHVHPATLLPSLRRAPSDSVTGLCAFGVSEAEIKRVGGWYEGCIKVKAEVEIGLKEGGKMEIEVWTWVDKEVEGWQERWTVEDYVAGNVVGSGGARW